LKDAQKPDHVSLNALISRMKDGRFVVPDFQREFEWEPWDILALMRSIFLDYYIGSLLLWRSTDEHLNDLSCEPLYGFEGQKKPEYIVLDGQQRLTAMYYAFVAPNAKLPRRKHRAHYYIRVDHFMAEKYDDSFEYEWHRGDWPAVLANHDIQYDRHIFPLSVVGAGGWDLGNWVQGYEKYWAAKVRQKQEASEDPEDELIHAANAKAFGGHLREIVEQFQISYVELDKALSIDKVCDIFTQINSRGIRLDVFDLMNALLKPRGLQLKTLWRDAAPKLSFVETPRMNIYLLQTMSILRQAYCSPKYLYFLLPGAERPIRRGDGTLHKEVLVPDILDFQNRWNASVSAFERTIKMLRHPQEYGVTASHYLPYVSILPVLAALQSLVDSLPAERRLLGRRRLRHWYWASVFTNRYSGSVESTSARDFQDVRSWLADDNATPALIGEFKQRFNVLDLRAETKRGNAIYNAIFNLLVVQGARDWMTGDVPQPDDLDDHHIVPASWGGKNISGSLINSILNRTPLTSTTNREVISDRLPNAYLPELIANAGRDEVERHMASHSISPVALDILLRDPFGPADFDAFIQERQKTLLDAIESLLVNERLDLPPALRVLDQRVEKVELRLRAVIVEAAANDTARLPPHVMQKLDERVQRELKKNPSLDINLMKNLSGRLEYADLRELQDSIGGKDLWESFAPRFGTKEGLAMRFNQLAELRNGIRHSRTTTPVTLKDGEAAILWFESALTRKPT
jgi:hypothetical protein